ncbi:MAG TPA: glycosyltransferase family 61 protein [Rhizomicrobium sp.]|jgi:hypothetical protein|nr:glycosyltransferase family 61 protein [Rhizomicrobium sp.]
MSMKKSDATAEWLAEHDVLAGAEVQSFRQFRHLPSDFRDRVARRWGLAVPTSSTESVNTENVIWVDAFDGAEPPILTYAGPMPRQFRQRRLHSHNVRLHDIRMGKMFVGYRRSTLFLDSQHYFEGVSAPGSTWITPAFASAPADLSFDGTVAVLFADGASLFSHWMFDLLPKLEVLRRAGWTPDKVDCYVVNSNGARFCAETLARLGIPLKKTIHGAGRSISAERLLIPSRVRRGFWTPSWVREFVATTFLGDGGRSIGDRSTRVYVSRAKAKRRRIINEDEVRYILEKRKFEVFVAEDMAVAEFAEIVRGASAMVAPHGAGVTNVAFARPGVRVLEMFGAHIAPEGWLMTNSVGGQHYILAGKDKHGRYPWHEGVYEGYSWDQRNEEDYLVDAGDLEGALDIMGVQ